MSDTKKALVLHVVSAAEPIVFALAPATAQRLVTRLSALMTSGTVDGLELEDGNTVTVNFGHVVSAHIDELPPLSRIYGSNRKSQHGFGA